MHNGELPDSGVRAAVKKQCWRLAVLLHCLDVPPTDEARLGAARQSLKRGLLGGETRREVDGWTSADLGVGDFGRSKESIQEPITPISDHPLNASDLDEIRANPGDHEPSRATYSLSRTVRTPLRATAT